MCVPSFKKWVFFAITLLVFVSAAIADDQAPSIFKWLTEPKTKEEQAPVEEGASDVHIKEITKLAPKASVVLDKNCPEIVQPYKLTDNLASVAVFGLKEGAEAGIEMLGSGLMSLMQGQSVRSIRLDRAQNIPASTKLAAKQLNWLPMSAEVLYGEELHKEETNILERERKLGKKYYPIADKMLLEILSKIDQPHDYQFKLFILKNSGGNAIARPGGFLYIDQGLIDNSAKHPKAYFALAHEVAHVLQRHETKELQSMVIDSVSDTSDLLKIMSGVRNNPNIILTHVKLEKNLFTRHHIDQELQADSCAVKLLSRVFPEGQGLTNSIKAFLKDLPPAELDKPAPPPQSDLERVAASVHDVVNTPVKRHPNSQERMQNLNAIYAEIQRGGR